jgi:large subunit ribosomal protein L28
MGLSEEEILYLCCMARQCEVTGRRPRIGYKVSHSNRHTKRRFDINLQYKRIPLVTGAGSEGLIRLKLTARALKTLYRKGYLA